MNNILAYIMLALIFTISFRIISEPVVKDHDELEGTYLITTYSEGSINRCYVYCEDVKIRNNYVSFTQEGHFYIIFGSCEIENYEYD